MCTREQVFFHRRHSPTHETRASRWGLMRSKCPWKRVYMKVEKNMRPSLINKQERIFFPPNLSSSSSLCRRLHFFFLYYSRYVASESIHVSFVSWLRVEKKQRAKFTCLSLTSARSMKLCSWNIRNYLFSSLSLFFLFCFFYIYRNIPHLHQFISVVFFFISFLCFFTPISMHFSE